MARNGILSRINNYLTSRYTHALMYGTSKMYHKQYARLLKKHPVSKLDSEKYYLQLWTRLSKNPDKSTYRLFSQYIGEDSRIAPEDVVQGIIQPLLNPIEYRAYYQDKNMFDKIIPSPMSARTLLRGIRGGYFDIGYKHIKNIDSFVQDSLSSYTRVFIKPAVDSSSGEGVIGFERSSDNKLHSLIDNRPLTEEWIKQYAEKHPDFIIQEGLTQHSDLAQFNPSSINTIRVATYRSVYDNKTHFLNAVLRIGKKGAFVDNAHAGGVLIGIDRKGVLAEYAVDQYGTKYESFNGIPFKGERHIIPSFDEIIQFSENVGEHILHARLVAQDICIDENGNPKLIEYNLRAFGHWAFQFTTGPAFAEYTDEIIQYCVEHKKEIRKVLVEPF